MKWENMKKLFAEVTDYFKADKVELSDDTLDCVVGGWSLSGFWNKYKKAIISTAIIVGCAVALGVVTGGVGAVVGVCAAAEGIGTVAGYTAVSAAIGAVGGALGGAVGI